MEQEGSEDPYDAIGYGDFSTYFRHKKQKLQLQQEEMYVVGLDQRRLLSSQKAAIGLTSFFEHALLCVALHGLHRTRHRYLKESSFMSMATRIHLSMVTIQVPALATLTGGTVANNNNHTC